MSIFICEYINEILKKLSSVWIDGKVLMSASKMALLSLPYELQSLIATSGGEESQERGIYFFLFLITQKFLYTLVKRKSKTCLWMYLPAKDNPGSRISGT